MPVAATNKRISVTLKRSTAKKIEDMANREEVTQSVIAARIIEKYFSENP